MWTSTAFLSSQEIVIVARVSAVAYLEQEVPLFFSYKLFNARNQEKLLPTSYIQGPNINGLFLGKAPRSSSKKLILSMPLLL
jgi:hypothetical protein